MSDRPNDTSPNPSGFTGGWEQPRVTGSWHEPTSEKPQDAGWRTVKTLPDDLDADDETGAWHLPSPDDTSFSPEDEIQISEGDNGAAIAESEIDTDDGGTWQTLDTTVPESEVLEEADDAVDDLLDTLDDVIDDEEAVAASSDTGILAPLPFAEAGAEEVEEEVEPPEEDAEPEEEFSIEDSGELAALEVMAAQEDAPAVPEIVEEEDSADLGDELSLQERIALMQAGEFVVDTSATETMPVDAIDDTATIDPGEYARQQLAELSGQEDGGASPSGEGASGVGTTSVVDPGAADPGEYARQQLAALGGQDAGTAAYQPTDTGMVETPQQAEITPAQQQLKEKFEQTEQRVAALRQQYQAGTITREGLQNELRNLMILDEDQNWWMMGVETDTWYRFENGEWQIATPPFGTSATGAQLPAADMTGQQINIDYSSPVTQTTGIDPVRPVDYSLPVLDDTDAEASEATTGHQPGTEGMDAAGLYDLPQQVPLQDPNATLPGGSGIELGDYRSSEAPTLEAGIGSAAPTQIGYQPVEDQYAVVEAPDAEADVDPPTYSEASLESETYRDAVERQRRSLIVNVVRVIAAALVVVLIAAIATVIGLVFWYQNIATQWDTQVVALANYEPDFRSVVISDARGDEITELTSEQGGARTEVPLSEMSPFIIHAVVSLENPRFFEDPGFDPFAIGRAFAQNLAAGGEIESGASTITQQIARQLILQDASVTANRKLNEIVIAAEIGQDYTKNEILELYLNEIYFGNQSYGVEAAAQFYFDVSAADLTLPQAAMLAGMIQAPATYDPVQTENRDVVFSRLDLVVDRMVTVGCLQFQHAPYLGEPFCITQQEVNSGQYTLEKAEVVSRRFNPREYDVPYPHFINFVVAQIERDFGPGELYRRGFNIRTTLVPEMQTAAQDALEAQVNFLGSRGVNTGAIMVTDPRDGAIRAMVGSPDFNNDDIDGQVNNTLTWQSPGSSIKPIVYTASLEGRDANNSGSVEQGEYYTPATVLWDVPSTYSNGTPISNFDGRYVGPVAARFALQNSYNIPAVKVFDFIGAERFADTARRMGLGFLEGATINSTAAVGGVDVRLYDMMEAYGTLATQGTYNELYAIVEVTDANSAPVELPAREAQQVVRPQLAYLMQNIMSDDAARAAAFGNNNILSLDGFDGLVAAKTGTSNDVRDMWTMGFTTNAVVGVWLGRPDNGPTNGTSGYVSAAPVWNQTMRAVLNNLQRPGQFQPPQGIVAVQICASTGAQFDNNCPGGISRSDVFWQNQPPPAAGTGFVVTVPIDSWTRLRANDFCPNNVLNETFVSIDDPFALQWLNSGAGQATANRLGLPQGLPAPPTAECSTGTNIPTVVMQQPGAGQVVVGTQQISGQVAADPFSRYQIEVADAATPTSFIIVDGPYTSQQPANGSVLGTWDTSSYSNGEYIVRLSVFSTNGGFVTEEVTVNLNNPTPTPSPTPTQFPTTIPSTATLPAPIVPTNPLPFDPVGPLVPEGGGQVVPPDGGGGVPTATATLEF